MKCLLIITRNNQILFRVYIAIKLGKSTGWQFGSHWNLTQTSPVSWLKYSTVKADTGEAPLFGFGFQANRTLVSRTSETTGLDGGPGYVDGSGVRRKMIEGSVGASTDNDPLQAVSPVSLIALQVYHPVSVRRSSTRKQWARISDI